MICNISPKMTHGKCRASGKQSACGRCPGPGTEIVTFDESTYAALVEFAEEEGVSVAVSVTRFVSELVANLRQRLEREGS